MPHHFLMDSSFSHLKCIYAHAHASTHSVLKDVYLSIIVTELSFMNFKSVVMMISLNLSIHFTDVL